MNFETFEAAVRGEPLRLTQLEMTLLRYFVENEGRVIPRRELLQIPDTMKERGSPRKVRLGVVRNPSLRNPFQETPECYTSVSTNTSGS